MNPKLSKAVDAVYLALEEAVKISDEVGEGFDFSPVYGMGGYYTPKLNVHYISYNELLLMIENASITHELAAYFLREIEKYSHINKSNIRININSKEVIHLDQVEESGWHPSSQSC